MILNHIIILLGFKVRIMSNKKSAVCSGCNQHSIIVKLKQLVRIIGVPIHIIGYTYIVNAVECMLNSDKVMFLNDIYDIIALKNNTSIICVEVAIRNAIKRAVKSKTDMFQTMFSFCNMQPSNSVFLNTLKEAILTENME